MTPARAALIVIMIGSVIVGTAVLFYGGLNLGATVWLVTSYGIIAFGAILTFLDSLPEVEEEREELLILDPLEKEVELEREDLLKIGPGKCLLFIGILLLATTTLNQGFIAPTQDGLLVLIPSISYLFSYLAYRAYGKQEETAT
jgi:hypothetical protein